MQGWATKLRTQMPIKIRDIQITDAKVLTRSNSLEIRGFTPSFSITSSNRISQAKALKPFLLGQYCSSGAPQRNIGLVSRTYDSAQSSSYVYRITPGDCPGGGSTGVVKPPTGPVNPSGPTTGKVTAVEQQFWDAVKNSRRKEDYQSYIDSYPRGNYVPLAKLNISRLGGTVKNPGTVKPPVSPTTATTSVEEQFWAAVKGSKDEKDFQRYLNSFPKGKYAPLANLRIAQIVAAKPKKPAVRTAAEILRTAQPGNLSELKGKRTFFVASDDTFAVKRNIANEIRKLVPKLTGASSAQTADFIVSYKTIDTTTGKLVKIDPGNPNLQGEMWVFTIVSGTNPPIIRLHRRIIKPRGFGVFSRTPDINAARDLAKELARVM